MNTIPPIEKVLVANRGEIAIRLCRGVQEEGKRAVAIYESPDAESRHLRIADEAVWIGPGPRKDYLDIDRIIWAARKSGAQAVHPGYGFLAENPQFAAACEEAGLIFIGPSAATIQDLGDKTISRRLAEEAGLPTIPGSGILPPGGDGKRAAVEFGAKYGYPVMLKAVAGGGGRGIRKVDSEKELLSQIEIAKNEAISAFGDGRLYLEKGIVNPRHIEVQILGDQHGNVIHMGGRNCSIQRRHQKLVEIAPSLLDPALEEKICQSAIQYAKHVGYVNAGTVEFLVDSDDSFYFLEINTRLQVEHTVTEVVTGIDIVRRMIRVAEGKKLDVTQDEVFCRGFAIEMRINAEDPKQDFAPESGKHVAVYNSPGGPGIRLDGMAYQGYTIPTEYDSLLVKLTVYGFRWEEAVSRLSRALKNYRIVGPKTTIPFYRKLVLEPEFASGSFDTGYLERHPELYDYSDQEAQEAKVAKLLSAIHYHGKNIFAE
ncbi:Pyruvate carboxylase, biotin carboxylase subunit [Desulfatibacillum aliphaticivorans]|uniref:Pyruvate carboxylase, biotin carboxylase subunit n=1 Tax=Desulfatibacillum aliphaticivorans TaxID=218208 RepID=B8FL79_DESAL|nr:biotin carboxylase N-terminal domain-containing protein [Desulfatibacillum aliphaticivorans]ACL04714.1 Pyruvate carboxylase, biotin carboxylase subunit [Desulfatibacillum aliphaticivorans]